MNKITVNNVTIEIPDGYNASVINNVVRFNPTTVKKASPAKATGTEAVADKIRNDGVNIPIRKLVALLNIADHYDYFNIITNAFPVNIEYINDTGEKRSYHGWMLDPKTHTRQAVRIHREDDDEWRTLRLGRIMGVRVSRTDANQIDAFLRH